MSKLKFLTLAFLIPLAARADDVAQVITVTATRIPTPAQKTPAGVTVITRQDFEKKGYTTLVQALAAVPGLGVVQSGGAGTQASVFIRGTDSEDVLVLLDGVPVNDPSEANGAFNFGDYTLNDVERIEVVRGAMSGLYGSNAIGGVINIITTQGAGAPKASVTLAGGWPSQGQGSAMISGASGKFDYALSGALDEESGFDATAKRLSVYAGVRDPFRSKLGALNLGYTPVDGTRVYVVLRAQQVDAAYPDLGYPIYDDPNEFDHNTNYFGKLGVTSTIGALNTELFMAHLRNTLHNTNLLDADDPNQVQSDETYRGDRTDAQWNNTLHLPGNASSLLFGVEYINDTSNENVNDAYYGSPFTATVKAAQRSWAGHLGAQTTLFNRLTLTAALREDSVSSFGNALTGRVGGVLAVPEAYLTLKASYGTGFLAPSLFDLYGVDSSGGYSYAGNPALKAEHSSGYEAGPEFDIPAFGQEDFASVSATYFQTNIRDLITFVSLPPDYIDSTEENIGEAKIHGVETELALNPAPWASLDVNYTYTSAQDAETGTQLLRRPQHAGAATLTLTPVPALSIVPQVQYIGRFVDDLYDHTGYPSGTGSAKPGTIVNLTANYKICERFTVFAQGKNIFNSNFEAVNGLQIPGASLLLGVKASIQ
jgi:vitamin B12 transporter